MRLATTSDMLQMNGDQGPTVDFGPVDTVSVVIAVYNGERYIAEAIDSALTQTVKPHEIIVVDDGSLDGTADVASGYDAVTVIRQANQTQAVARNTGLAAATGDAVVFLDHDDRLLPENLEIGRRRLNENPKAGFCAGFSVPIDEHGHRSETATPVGTPPPCTFAKMLAGHVFVPPSTVMFRRAALNFVGGFDEEVRVGVEDDDIYLRIAEAFPVMAHEDVVVEYRRHSTNASSIGYKLVLGPLQLVEKFRPRVQGKPELEAALEAGFHHKLNLFGDRMVAEAAGKLRRGEFRDALKILALAARWRPSGFRTYAFARTRRLLGR